MTQEMTREMNNRDTTGNVKSPKRRTPSRSATLLTTMARSIAFLVLAAVFLAGCASPESRVVGKWKGEVQLSKETEASPLGAMVKGFAAGVDPQLDLRPDHTFSLYMSVMPIEGTWTLEGNTIVLQPEKYGGINPAEVQRSFEKGMERWSKDGNAPPGAEALAKDMPKAGSPIRIGISDDFKTLSLEKGQAGIADMFGSVSFKKV